MIYKSLAAPEVVISAILGKRVIEISSNYNSVSVVENQTLDDVTACKDFPHILAFGRRINGSLVYVALLPKRAELFFFKSHILAGPFEDLRQ